MNSPARAVMAALTCIFFAAVTPSWAQSKQYSLDGIVLGSNVRGLIASRGDPQLSLGGVYKWKNGTGGTLLVTTLSGTIVAIDVRAGANEQRSIQLPSGAKSNHELIFHYRSHENYIAPPEATDPDRCGYNLSGMPCIALMLSSNAELILNFGSGVGPDGTLSEVILGRHDALKADRKVVVAVVIPTPGPSPTPPSSFSLDGVTLGSPIRDLVARRGSANLLSDGDYLWNNPQGGKLRVTADSAGTIIIIDVQAGKSEVRSINISDSTVRFNDGGHVNNPQPPWANPENADNCAPTLRGSPCWCFLLSRGAELVMNFGRDTGFADWDLTELILGQRDALLTRRVVVPR